ncbi:hypothetical protein QAC54_03890 [Staphylococcus aureus]
MIIKPANHKQEIPSNFEDYTLISNTHLAPTIILFVLTTTKIPQQY